MPEIEITDQLDRPIETINLDPKHPSSLLKYAKTELLHMAVVPDFLDRRDKTLSQAATRPIRFDVQAGHSFEAGSTKRIIEITPEAKACIRVNASPGTDLFDSDPFHAPATVPEGTGYVAVGFEGCVAAGIGSSGDNLCFGFTATRGVRFEYLKAFRLGNDEPALGRALRSTLSSFVIPADLSDFEMLSLNDAATVCGEGSLQIAGRIRVKASPNPLASVDLPLGAGTVAVREGAVAGVSACLTLSGSYEVRARRKDADTIELSVWRIRGKELKVDLSASAGVGVKFHDNDLIPALISAISTDPLKDKKLLADLSAEELETFSKAVRKGIDHSIHASVGLTLSAMSEHEAAFRYDVQPARLTANGKQAIQRALHGDLTLLTSMEEDSETGGALAPGIQLLTSLFAETRKRGTTLKLNLIGIVNLVSVSELVRRCEILTDVVSGDITIKETVSRTSVKAVVEPYKRDEALRKALFDSVLVTTAYRAGRVVTLPTLSCEQMHFALNQNTTRQTMEHYLSWFIALNLLTPAGKEEMLQQFTAAGPSSCVLRTSFDDLNCTSMFFRQDGALWPIEHYQDIGRHSMQALLDPARDDIDRLRLAIVGDRLWPKARDIGANVNLGPLVGLSTADQRVGVLIGDVFDIKRWAEGMVAAGKAVQGMRDLIGSADPTMLARNDEFNKRRNDFQKTLADMVKRSKQRFSEPWGMICLFRAAGSPNTAFARAVAERLTIQRPAQALVSTA